MESLLPLFLRWPADLDVSNNVYLTLFSLLFLLAVALWFAPFLKYVATEVPPALLIGSALGSKRSVLELAETGRV